MKFHMMENTPTWMSWRGMKHRCLREKDSAFHRYGAVGIKICDFLVKSPLNLVKAIGLRPIGKTIDRIDSRLHYSCGRCACCRRLGWTKNIRWATPKEQCRNRVRSAATAFVRRRKMFLSDIAAEAGLSYNSIRRRVAKGVAGISLLNPAPPCRVKYRIGNESMTLLCWSIKTGISTNTLKTRTRKGIRGAALIATPRKTGRHAHL